MNKICFIKKCHKLIHQTFVSAPPSFKNSSLWISHYGSGKDKNLTLLTPLATSLF